MRTFGNGKQDGVRAKLPPSLVVNAGRVALAALVVLGTAGWRDMSDRTIKDDIRPIG